MSWNGKKCFFTSTERVKNNYRLAVKMPIIIKKGNALHMCMNKIRINWSLLDNSEVSVNDVLLLQVILRYITC